MCGRFTITHPNEALAALFDAVPGLERHPYAALNSALFEDGVLVHVAAGARLDSAIAWNPTSNKLTVFGGLDGVLKDVVRIRVPAE